MRWGFPPNRIFFAAFFLMGVGVGIAGRPVWQSAVMMLAQHKFGTLTFKCDDAMRSHLLAKQKVVASPSTDNVSNLEATEIGLLDCQEYDLMRKRLIHWGLSENEVSEMALRAVEEQGTSLQPVIRIHEIRY